MSAAPTDCRVPDPSDKLDAKADGNFGNHRAGYGDRLDRIIATARKGWTLAAGEGLVLVQEIDRLRSRRINREGAWSALMEENKRLRDELTQQSITMSAEHQRAERILAALREPSDFVIEAIDATAWDQGCARLGLPACALVARAAVAAAEQEVADDR